ncbi:tyrosine-type recombinase/integrase [Aestuariicoccus sp. MJ-SS9]|uniref:tyrosine-type recombinase/integrase n=1 Tax=Aestuariicoccus sp. MJ-SS9 TaxID=3079855 RepID=UPI00290DB1D9|nr:integrase arm-type DNA-binding domain-containing protein [Aestuariicoccus sp. MJ-SS9]MDU8913889.1 integrase arm-type DNA-binding domain-containing protein [Aestuariicoccus sp. MJ-SS9]
MTRLTNASIARMEPPKGRQTFVNDEDTPGLAVRLSPGGTKAFVYQFRDPITRRKKRKTLGRCSQMGIDTARKIVRELQAKVLTGDTPFSAPSVTLQDAYDNYQNTHLIHRRPSTTRTYRNIWTHVPKQLALTPLARLRRADFTSVIDGVQAKGTTGSAVLLHKVLKAVLNHAVRKGHLELNPLTAVPAPAGLKPRERVLSSDELRAVLQAAERMPTPTGALVRTLVLTGCRKSEVFGLTWDEVVDGVMALPPERTKNGHAHRALLQN